VGGLLPDIAIEIRRSLVQVLSLHFSPFGDQMTADEVGKTCRAHGGDEKCIKYFDQKTWSEVTTTVI
jgi:hypothetical protein